MMAGAGGYELQLPRLPEDALAGVSVFGEANGTKTQTIARQENGAKLVTKKRCNLPPTAIIVTIIAPSHMGDLGGKLAGHLREPVPLRRHAERSKVECPRPG